MSTQNVLVQKSLNTQVSVQRVVHLTMHARNVSHLYVN